MANTITDQSFATIWGIPYVEAASSGDLSSGIADMAGEMLSALEFALGNVALRTAQLRKAAKLAIGLEALLASYGRDPTAFSKDAVSTARPRPDEIEAQVRAGAGPKADTIAKAVAFSRVTGRPHPSRDALTQAAAYMAARSLMESGEAALVRGML